MNKDELILTAKPILFNTEMVHAILNGSKTMTRRLIKPQPCIHFSLLETLFSIGGRFPYNKNDILYVRETWGTYTPDPEKFNPRLYFKASDHAPNEIKWRPSIHMPKEVARIFLRVTGVKVERLQDITMDDMKAEGVIPQKVTGGHWKQWQRDYMKPVWNNAIKSKNYTRYCWDANPWVWVINFEKIEVD